MNADVNDPVPDMEMTTKEAAAYLSTSEYRITPKLMYALRSVERGPAAEKRGSRLVYRKSALDAFIAEFGTNPWDWNERPFQRTVEQLRELMALNPGLDFSGMIEAMDEPAKDGWDPDLA